MVTETHRDSPPGLNLTINFVLKRVLFRTHTGDSGGPAVVIDESGEPKLAGLVSWGIGCGELFPASIRFNNISLADWKNHLCKTKNSTVLAPGVYAALFTTHVQFWMNKVTKEFTGLKTDKSVSIDPL